VQQQAYIPYRDISLIIKGAHPAQRRPCKLVAPLIVETKIEGYYDGWELANGATIQFRTTENKADALQGRRFAAISFDEAAFETHLKVVVNEVLMMRLVASGGPLLLVSTPNGLNEFTSSRSPSGSTRTWTCPRSGCGGHLMDGRSCCRTSATTGVRAAARRSRAHGARSSARDEGTAARGAFLEPAEAFFVPSVRILSSFVDLPSLSCPVRAITTWRSGTCPNRLTRWRQSSST
jgi:hypothetical protein